MEQAAAFIIAAVPCLVIARGFFGGVDPYQAFVGGAKEGMQQAAALFPALAAMMLMLEMVSISGLDTLIMGLFDEAKLREIFAIPEDEKITVVIAIGKGAQEPVLRPRKSLEEILTIR